MATIKGNRFPDKIMNYPLLHDLLLNELHAALLAGEEDSHDSTK